MYTIVIVITTFFVFFTLMVKLFSKAENPIDLFDILECNDIQATLLYVFSYALSFLGVVTLICLHAYYLFPFIPLMVLLFVFFNVDWIQIYVNIFLTDWKLTLKRKLQDFLTDDEQEKHMKKHFEDHASDNK